jgi:chromosome partitioning protein
MNCQPDRTKWKTYAYSLRFLHVKWDRFRRHPCSATHGRVFHVEHFFFSRAQCHQHLSSVPRGTIIYSHEHGECSTWNILFNCTKLRHCFHRRVRTILRAAEVNTLLVDCDPQSNTTSGLGLVKDPERISTYDVLMGVASAEEALRLTELEQLWLIPSHKNLIGANLELVSAERREFRLREALAPLLERFQFIVLDCPPALDLLTLNALVAADGVLIPMQAEYFALEGVSELLDTVDRIKVGLNPALEVEGVVLTMFDDRTNLAQQVAEELRKYFGEKMCVTTIPRNIRLAEAPSHGKPALVYDVRSRGAESYIRLAKEILDRQAGVATAAPDSGEAA